MTKNKLALSLTVTLLLLSAKTFADENEHSNPSNLQLQIQAQKQSQTGSTANSTNDIHISSPRVASSAIAPSLSQYSDCPIVSPASKAGSVFFFSGSGTTGQTINGICVAKFLGEIDVMRKIACSNSREYHDANITGTQT